jgi:hypothetical protein
MSKIYLVAEGTMFSLIYNQTSFLEEALKTLETLTIDIFL